MRMLPCLSGLLFVACAHALPTVGTVPASAPANAEQATARYLASIQGQPGPLLAFMHELPKGADLHNHLSGAVYAEHFLEWAAEDGRCIDVRTTTVVAAPCDSTQGRPSATSVLHDDLLNRQAIDAWSMRDFVPSAGNSGHDHFFDTFAKFDMADQGHRGDELALVMHQAAAEHTLYLELMVTPAEREAGALAERVGWTSDFAALRQRLLPGMPTAVDSAVAQINAAEHQMRVSLHCGTPQADAGCAVQVRYLYQVLRGLPPQDVFAQILLGFELATRDPRVVGLNLVMPEDGLVSMRDFRLHMSMLDSLHALYPTVHISLHAGELAPGMVPPDGLRFHIRASVEQGHAERIGHGVDIMGEDEPYALLREMAQRHVLVEICLTSNKTILGIQGAAHPLPVYLRMHVPVALATDDAGVSRSSLSQEFVLAEQEFQLPYETLKVMIRDGLDHAFVAGASLWIAPEEFRVVAPCAADTPGAEHPSLKCGQYLAQSEKATLEWREEGALTAFEARMAKEHPSD